MLLGHQRGGNSGCSPTVSPTPCVSELPPGRATPGPYTARAQLHTTLVCMWGLRVRSVTTQGSASPVPGHWQRAAHASVLSTGDPRLGTQGGTAQGRAGQGGLGGREDTQERPLSRPPPTPGPPRALRGPVPHVQVVLPLEGLAADLADVLPLLAVRQVVLAERAGAAEHLPAEAAVQERVLGRAVLPLSFPGAPGGGPACFLRLLRHLQRAEPQV